MPDPDKVTPNSRYRPRKPSTETMLRLCMLVFWFMIGVAIIGGPKNADEQPNFLQQEVAITAFLVFGLALWINTASIERQLLERRRVVLLAYQAICGFILHTDLLYLVAAQIPLVLPARLALTWFLGQTALLAVWIFLLDWLGAPLQFMALPKLPHIAVILLTDITVFAGHGFAFFMGDLAASEARGRRAAERTSAELAATRQLLAENSRAAERGFIARELHDALGHHLVALKVNLELARHAGPEASRAALDNAFALASRLLVEVREVVAQVRTPPPVDLRDAIALLLNGVNDFAVTLDFPDSLQIRDPAHAHALFRCVQEAVTNTLKHADAHRLWVSFSGDTARIRLHIRDDGQGSHALTAGTGLAGMRERLEALGGQLKIEPGLGRGFALTATLPLPAEADQPIGGPFRATEAET